METRLRYVDSMGKYCIDPFHRLKKTTSQNDINSDSDIDNDDENAKNNDTNDDDDDKNDGMGRTHRVCMDKKIASRSICAPDAGLMHP